MQAHRLSTFARLAVVVTAAMVLSACAHAPAQHRPDPYYDQRGYDQRDYDQRASYYDYRYYPDADYYYDTRTRVYIYYEHNHWVRARTLPRRYHSHSGGHIDIRSPHNRPYEDKHRHRERYQSEQHHKPRARDDDRRSRVDTPRNMAPQRDRNEIRHNNEQRDRNHQPLTRERSQDNTREPWQKRRADAVQADQQPAPRQQSRGPRTESDRQETPVDRPPVEQRNQRPDRKSYKQPTPDQYAEETRPLGDRANKRRNDENTRDRRQARDETPAETDQKRRGRDRHDTDASH